MITQNRDWKNQGGRPRKYPLSVAKVVDSTKNSGHQGPGNTHPEQQQAFTRHWNWIWKRICSLILILVLLQMTQRYQFHLHVLQFVGKDQEVGLGRVEDKLERRQFLVRFLRQRFLVQVDSQSRETISNDPSLCWERTVCPLNISGRWASIRCEGNVRTGPASCFRRFFAGYAYFIAPKSN